MALMDRLIPDNPVLTQELRSRMRGARAYWIMGVFLAFLSLVLVGFYAAWQQSTERSGAGFSQASTASGQIFYAILVTQSFLVLFITPALTSGAITIEREQKTMDMLDLTPLPRRSIVTGKLVSAVAYIGLLILSSLPLVSICFMLGSIDPAQILATYLALLFTSFFVGAVGLMWSSVAKSTTHSIIYTYISLFLPLFFLMVTGVFSIANRFGTGSSNIATDVMAGMFVPWSSNTVFGIKVIDGVSGYVLFAIAGLLLASVARVRLEMFPERKGWIPRSLMALLFAFSFYHIDTWWLSGYYHIGLQNQALQMNVVRPTAALMIGTIALMLVTPLFTTGDFKPYEVRRYFARLLAGISLAGVRRGKPTSGVTYMVVLTALVFCIYGISFVAVGKAKDINSDFGRLSAGTPAANASTAPVAPIVGVQSVLPGVKSAPPPPPDPLTVNATSPAYLARIGGVPQIALAVVSFVVGFSLFCLLLSLIFRSRWPALALSYIALLAIWIAPTTNSYRYVGNTAIPSSQIYVAILNPIMAIHQIADPVDFMHYDQVQVFRDHVMWQETTLAWLVLGGLFLLLAVPLVVLERKHGADIPFEEMVANA